MTIRGPARPVARQVTIVNERGLHARAAVKFVKCAARFKAEIVVAKDGTAVSGRSIMGLLMLAAAPGCTLRISAEGPEAAPAVDALSRLVADKFDED